MTSTEIYWPASFHPNVSAIHVINRLQMEAAPRDIWNRLIDAVQWPDWYPNAANVQLLETDDKTLKLGTRFRWKTFGVTIECKVKEFEPESRLAWSSKSMGMAVYHAWLITPQQQGCHVVTEETQNGLIPRLAAVLRPGQMHKYHQIWLERLNEIAQMSD